MNHNQLPTISTLFSHTWEQYKKHAALLLLLGLAVLIVDVAAAHVPVLGSIVHLLTTMVLITTGLMVARGHTPTWTNIFDDIKNLPKVLWFFLGSILVGLGTALGLVLLIVPGVYFMFRACITTFLIIEKGLGPIDAIKKSFELTKGHFWPLFCFGVVALILAILGGITVVGAIFVTPFLLIAASGLYLALIGEHHHAAHMHAEATHEHTH